MNVKPLLVLLAVFSLLVLMHSAATPVFEAPDEVWHYAYVRWLAEGHGLPAMDDDASGANQEVAQPPLYYAVAALLSAPFPDDDLDALMWSNPGFGYQAPGTTPDNKNMLIHTDRERWPWHGAVLTIHITRLVSLLFGLTTVIAAWGLGYAAFGTQRGARITAMLVAFHPQFVFMSSVVSNDSAAAALSTAALWAMAVIVQRGITLRRAGATGILVGLAALTKTSAILLLPLAGVVMAWIALRKTKARLGNRGYVVLFVYGMSALAVGGWWYGRNFALYGDPLGISNHANTPWGRPEIVSLPALLPELPLLLRSFWAAYGWGHVTWPDWVYWGLWGGVLVLLTRGLWRAVGTRHAPQLKDTSQTTLSMLAIALVWFGSIAAALLHWMQQVQAPHGRLLFPAIGAFALLLAYGMTTPIRPYSPTPLRLNWMTRISLTVLFLLTTLAPGARILATFAPPRTRPASVITSEGTTPVGFDYAKQARLLGVSSSTPRAVPGERITVKACWEALRPMAHDYTVFIHLIGPENSRVAERHTYPGLGRFPTSLWPVGRTFCDTYRLQIASWAETPVLYQVQVGLFDAETGERLIAARSDGSPADPPVVARLAVVPAEPVASAPVHTASASLGDAIALRGYDIPAEAAPGESITVTLSWEATGAPHEALVAFVHLWRPGDSAPLAQHDGVPRLGWYPTSVWQPGDVVTDSHPLILPGNLPPGDYPLWAGLYRAEDGTRLIATGTQGNYPHDLVPLGTITIKK